MKKTIITILAAFSAVSLSGQQFKSPDGRLAVAISCESGQPSYTLTYNDIPCVVSSPLGLVLDCADFSKALTIDRGGIRIDTVQVEYSLEKIKKNRVSHGAVEAVVPFTSSGKPAFELILHISDNDLAFKYRINSLSDHRVALVKEECTSFVFPDGSTTFLCPASTPMEGWKRTWPSYETKYVADDAMGRNGEGYGYTFPCLFHLPQTWVLVSETGVDGSYCASRLRNEGGAAYAIGFPDQAEMNGAGNACPLIRIPGETPWRTVTVGTDLAPIVETTIP
ncbi:MAG: glycoside hydrolase family 97 N-terminal domain-containing protein, partial [Candidatus Cryptobacteroides sp.]